jgi:hypothetical protein
MTGTALLKIEFVEKNDYGRISSVGRALDAGSAIGSFPRAVEAAEPMRFADGAGLCSLARATENRLPGRI